MKTNLRTKVGFGFLTAIAIVFVLSFITQNISGQKNDDPSSGKNAGKPKIDIKVNKDIDKDGNITRYDSTYSWSWSNDGQIPENIDSIFRSMHQNFFQHSMFDDSLFFSMPLDFKVPFFNDSLWNSHFDKDFFNYDFGNIEKLLQERNKWIEKYFRNEPFLMIPDNKETLPPDKNKENKIPKEENKIKTEKISGVGVEI
jgi:hypothetical protein